MRWQCEHCNSEFFKSYALTQHISQRHPYLQDMTNQSVEQVDNDIWNLPDYSSSYYSFSEHDSNDSKIYRNEVTSTSPTPGIDSSIEIEDNFNENEDMSESSYLDMEIEDLLSDS
ncbi:14432_t:CDS:2, partial [Ambispora leptoticha]